MLRAQIAQVYVDLVISLGRAMLPKRYQGIAESAATSEPYITAPLNLTIPDKATAETTAGEVCPTLRVAQRYEEENE